MIISKSHLKPLDIYWKDRDEESMYQEPMRDKDYDSEYAELMNSPRREKRDYANNGVIGNYSASIRSSCLSKANSYALFNR